MKLDALSPKKTADSLVKMLESRFDYHLNLKALNTQTATQMLDRTMTRMKELREHYGSVSVQKPKYIKQRLLAETLQAYLKETKLLRKGTYENTAKLSKVKEEKTKVDESYLRPVFESDTDEAEVVLAAQNMVDKITGFLEDVGEMQNQQLLPLVDQIRGAMGDDQASNFQSTVETALSACLDSLKQTREQLVAAQGIVTGEEVPDMGADMGDMETPDLGMDDDMGSDLDGELDVDLDADDGDEELDLDVDDDFGASDAATGDTELAGREKRES